MKIETINAEQLAVEVTYNPDFNRDVKDIGGRWHAPTKRWIVPAAAKDLLEEHLQNHFGYRPADAGDTVTVEITARKELSERCASIYFRGRQVVRAFGRDSGAKVCEGGMLVSGKIGSGGSRATWYTNVAEGVVLRLVNVPRDIAEDCDDWTCKVVDEPTKTLEQLRERCADLANQILEIDAKIAALETANGSESPEGR